MKKLTLNALLAATLLAGAAQAQEAPKVHSLADAEAKFTRADKDEDGSLRLAEVKAIGFSNRAITDFDYDESGALSLREFVMAYRERFRSQGDVMGADLEAEATKALAERRAIQERRRAEKLAKEAREAKAKAAEEARRRAAERERRIRGEKKEQRPVPRPRPETPGRRGIGG